MQEPLRDLPFKLWAEQKFSGPNLQTPKLSLIFEHSASTDFSIWRRVCPITLKCLSQARPPTPIQLSELIRSERLPTYLICLYHLNRCTAFLSVHIQHSTPQHSLCFPHLLHWSHDKNLHSHKDQKICQLWYNTTVTRKYYNKSQP